MVVAQPSDNIAAGYGLAFFDKNVLNMTVQCDQSSSFLVSTMIDYDCRPHAALIMRFGDPPIGDCDYVLTSRADDVDALMDHIAALSVNTYPTMVIGHDSVRRGDICRVGRHACAAGADRKYCHEPKGSP